VALCVKIIFILDDCGPFTCDSKLKIKYPDNLCIKENRLVIIFFHLASNLQEISAENFCTWECPDKRNPTEKNDYNHIQASALYGAPCAKNSNAVPQTK